jgi:hypothetical protein
MSKTNDSGHLQRGVCRHCEITLHRPPDTAPWLDPYEGEECASAPEVDGDPGHHVPVRILNKPADPPATGPGPAPRIPYFPRTKGPW